MFKPAEVLDVLIGEENCTVTIVVPEKGDFGLAICKGWSTIDKARQLVRRFYNKDIGDILRSPERRKHDGCTGI